MYYEIVLKNRNVLTCWTKDKNDEGIIEMIFKHNLFVVQENEHPTMVSYIDPQQVSHFRIPKEKAAQPI